MSGAGIIVFVVLLAVALFLIIGLIASMFRKVGPNQALIVYGFGGTRVVIGNGKIVVPMLQQARELSLELMSFDVAPTQSLYTSQGVAVNVENGCRGSLPGCRRPFAPTAPAKSPTF